MRKKIFALLFALLSITIYSQSLQNSYKIVGEKIIIKSMTLKEDRNINILLPESYDGSINSFPVIYILDAEYKFNPAFGVYSYMTYWNGVPDAILVGISNPSRESRVRDYLPTPYGGNADNFLSFFKNELIPFIDKNYKSSGENYIVGHSHGGIFALYSFLKDPDLFKGYITCDPSIDGLYQIAETNLKDKYNNTIIYLHYSDIGNVDENMKQNHINGFNKFKELIVSKSISGLELKVDHVPDDHTNSYVFGISKGLRYIFKK